MQIIKFALEAGWPLARINPLLKAYARDTALQALQAKDARFENLASNLQRDDIFVLEFTMATINRMLLEHSAVSGKTLPPKLRQLAEHARNRMLSTPSGQESCFILKGLCDDRSGKVHVSFVPTLVKMYACLSSDQNYNREFVGGALARSCSPRAAETFITIFASNLGESSDPARHLLTYVKRGGKLSDAARAAIAECLGRDDVSGFNKAQLGGVLMLARTDEDQKLITSHLASSEDPHLQQQLMSEIINQQIPATRPLIEAVYCAKSSSSSTVQRAARKVLNYWEK